MVRVLSELLPFSQGNGRHANWESKWEGEIRSYEEKEEV